MMTEDQMDLILGVLSSGRACGLRTLEESVLNHLYHLPQFTSYTEVAQKERELAEALCEFLKRTGSCPEEDAELATLTPANVFDYLDREGTRYFDGLKERILREKTSEGA